MATIGHNQPDTVTLTGDQLSRIRRALEVAKHQVRVGQTSLDGHHLEGALTDAEDALGDLLASIEAAVQDDADDAEADGRADRQRRAWQPRSVSL